MRRAAPEDWLERRGVALAACSLVQLVVYTWTLIAVENFAWPDAAVEFAMLVAAAGTLTLAVANEPPRWACVLAALAQVAALGAWFAVVGAPDGEALERLTLIFTTGLFVLFLVPAAASALLVWSITARRPERPA